MNHWVIEAILDRRARAFRCRPHRAVDAAPPRNVLRSRRTERRVQEQVKHKTPPEAFRLRDVAGGNDEFAKALVGDRAALEPEAFQVHLAPRTFAVRLDRGAVRSDPARSCI